MRRKFVWVLANCLVVTALILAACQPAPTEPTTPTVPTTPTKPTEPTKPAEPAGPEMVTDALGRLVEKPQYGGTFIFARPTEPVSFDAAAKSVDSTPYWAEALVTGDYAKGPTGSGEASWQYSCVSPRLDLTRPLLAESWELTDPSTITIKVRKGVHFHNKPPTNGREMTAEDVAFNIRRVWTHPTGYYHLSYPWDKHWDLPPEEAITATDKYTVVLKGINPEKSGVVWEKSCLYCLRILPKDALLEYGDMLYWENCIGTGPFTLADYVPMSSITYEKNPDYWDTHPLFPQDKMPYLDKIRVLIVPDKSTRLAGLRTGKIDWVGGQRVDELISIEDRKTLQNIGWDLKYNRRLGIGNAIHWRLDKPELPISDIRVRRALMMAIDQAEIRDTYYKGEAELLHHPVAPILEFQNIYIPLEERPVETRELYEYHPEKARELLAEAGYPAGFKVKVISHSPEQNDLLSIVEDYWEDIGVDLEIQPLEYGTYYERISKLPKAYEEGAIAGASGQAFWHRYGTGNKWNYGCVSDPVIDAIYEDLDALYWDSNARYARLGDLGEYMPAQAYDIPLPCPYLFTAWQPWVKGYSGEFELSYCDHWNFASYLWIDQDLKYELMGRK